MKKIKLYRQRLSYRLFKKLHKKVPPMSRTEQEALDAGDPWWEAEFFSGKPDWQAFQKLKLSTLTRAEQAFLNKETTELCKMLDTWQISHHDKDLPTEVWQFIKDKGFWGLVIDKQYGGKGFSAGLHSAIIMKLASRSLTAAVTVMVPNSLGPGELLQEYGTSAQKKYYLPRLAKGLETPCFGLTGPYAGSDAASMVDSGVVCQQQIDGKAVLNIKLNFRKRYITLAPVATLIGLAFKLFDPDHLLGDKNKTDYGITVCLLPHDTKGVKIGKRHDPLGQAFMNGPIEGQDVCVPIDAIIGGSKMAGQGWRMLMECLAIGRSISLPAVSSAYCAFGALMTGAYVALREQFNVSIGQFEGVQAALAPIVGFSYLLNATRLLTLTATDKGKRPSVASAIAKYHMTELGRKALNHAMDIHGGKGIIMGPKNYLASAYQGIPICITVEGANILTRNLIIFGQGAVQCHPYLKDILQAIQDGSDKAFKQFDQSLFAMIRQVIRNMYFAKWWRVTGAVFSRVPTSKLSRYYQRINRLSAGFALVSDVSFIKLGNKLKRKERLSARLGDVISYLYMASATLKYFAESGEPDEERPVAEWAVQYCLHHAAIALDSAIKNFPGLIIRGLLRGIVLPFGIPYRKPNDILDAKVAQLSMQPDTLRNRLSKLCFIPEDLEDEVAIVETAFKLQYKLNPVVNKIKVAIKGKKIDKGLSKQDQIKAARAQKLITVAEAKQLDTLEKLRLAVIEVDAF